jgi:hypothetical protein
MKYLIVFVLFCVIIYNAYKHSIINVNEAFNNNNNNNNNNNIILLGDSSLKNNKYVVNSVESLLRKKINKDNRVNKDNREIMCFAKDGAKIKDVYKQIDNIPLNKANNNNNTIFLSVGGNDILEKNSNIDELFSEYEQLLNVVKTKCNKCVVCNLYLPAKFKKNIKKNDINNKIKHWNSKINEYITSNNVFLIPFDSLLYDETDFVSDYEPSELGGDKIVNSIVKMID